ncbi:hypothetical protein THAOC_04935, partial [Thalassiosira oceanica]
MPMIVVLEGGGTGLAGSRIGPWKIFRSSGLAYASFTAAEQVSTEASAGEIIGPNKLRLVSAWFPPFLARGAEGRGGRGRGSEGTAVRNGRGCKSQAQSEELRGV